MFSSAQYQLVDQFKDKDENKRLKMIFHAVLAKKEEEVWSSVKVVKGLNISRESLLGDLL